MSEKIVYLMRGLPSCGKSTTARKLAGNLGLVFETDSYFYRTGPEGERVYAYDEKLLPQARSWNLKQFKSAVDQGLSPLVVDRGNGLNLETRNYAQYAVEHHYRVELKEPDSPWWQEIAKLLRDKDRSGPLLEIWAEKLARLSQQTHRVPRATIRHWMACWRPDLTVEEILHFQPDR